MRLIAAIAIIGILALTDSRESRAQEADFAQRGPRFLATSKSGTVRVDVSRTPILRKRISVDLQNVSVYAAIMIISQESGLELIYTKDLWPQTRTVSLSAKDITVASALNEVLLDAGVDVLFSSAGNAALIKRSDAALAVGTLMGKVTDAASKEGLAGVSISVAGGRLSTATNPQGHFTLHGVPTGAQSVMARRLGYRSQSKKVDVKDNEPTTIDFAIERVATTLTEIVVTPTGEQRRLELGHVVGRVNADSLVREAPVSSVSDLLMARVPGLQVFQSQGTVGGEVTLRIRGPNSLQLNAEPVVIVDGVRYTTGAAQKPPIGGTTGSSVVEATSPLNDINPNSIESIEVVKGPSAATLYGTDAANGVIVITTKRGRSGPARWNVYAKSTRSTVSTQEYPELFWGWGKQSDGTPFSGNCGLIIMSFGICTQQDSVTVLPNALNDPEYTVFQVAPTWNYGGSVQGGGDDLRYFMSADREDATGPIKMPNASARRIRSERGPLTDEQLYPNAFEKTNLRANATALLKQSAELNVHSGYIRSRTRTLGLDARSPYSTGLPTATPTHPYGDPTTSYYAPDVAFAQTSTEENERFLGQASGQWRGSWLTARASVGLDFASRNQYSLSPPGIAPFFLAEARGEVVDTRGRQSMGTAELGLTGTLRRGGISSRTSVGGQYTRTLSDVLSTRGENLPTGATSVGAAATVRSSHAYRETVTLGSYVEEVLGVNDRLFLMGAMRIDGASTFGSDYTAAVYPRASVSWLLSQEKFFPRISGLDELRLRYAFGASGLHPKPEWSRPTYVPGQVIRNGVATTSTRLVGLGSPDLRPERVREQEIGLDAAGAQNRLQFGLTRYSRRTTDQIATTALPPGLGIVYTNLGLTTQHGLEAELTAQLVNHRILDWTVSLQHAAHRTKLVDLGDAVELRSPTGGWVEGYPLGARFITPITGFSDANSDGIIAENEVQIAPTEQSVYSGESTPPRSQTLTTVFGLFNHRLRLSALLERRAGFTQIDELANGACTYGTCRAVVDQDLPPEDRAQGMALRTDSYRVVHKGDFIRFRELAFTVQMPAVMVRSMRARSGTVSLAARNLALWTKFPGPDPESAAVNGVIGGSALGIPQTHSWTLRLGLEF